jgi:hypothetical protein
MKIDKISFVKAMHCIHAAMIANEIEYEKFKSVLGDTEQIASLFSIEPMVKLLETICEDSNGFIPTFIYESDWGKYDMCFCNPETNIKYPFKTYEDVYDILCHPERDKYEMVV